MTQTLNAFVRKYNVRMNAERTDSNPHMSDSRSMDHWRVTLRVGRRQMTLVFSQGFGHNGNEPTVDSVLDCLASDCSSAEGQDFEQWARDFGFDEDSRKAERTYKAITRQMRQLGQLLGADAYSELLWETERM